SHATPLRLVLRPGQSMFDQMVFAATKAFVSGEFRPGQPFPSVRVLAAELKVHPNTAPKVVQRLIQEGFLESRHCRRRGRATSNGCFDRRWSSWWCKSSASGL